MFNAFVNRFTDIFDHSWLQFMGNGIILFLIGLLIILVPEILVAFVASIFLLLGGLFFYLGWKIKKAEQNVQRIKIKYYK